VTTISEQVGAAVQVIDLASAAWREMPLFAVRIMADKAKFDSWVATLGGFAGARYGALRREALEFAGPDGAASYLDMCQRIDEEHAAGAGRWLAEAAIELANAKNAREAMRREVGARYGWDDLAAVVELSADPGLLDGPDFSTRAPMGRAEVDLELRAAMGLVNRPPSVYESSLPPVADLARMIGLRS
jgi:hypothetical protein